MTYKGLCAKPQLKWLPSNTLAWRIHEVGAMSLTVILLNATGPSIGPEWKKRFVFTLASVWKQPFVFTLVPCLALGKVPGYTKSPGWPAPWIYSLFYVVLYANHDGSKNKQNLRVLKTTNAKWNVITNKFIECSINLYLVSHPNPLANYHRSQVTGEQVLNK